MNPLLLAPAPRAVLAQQFRWEVPAFYNIAEATVTQAAARCPGRVALVEPQLDRKTTFAELEALSNRLANALQARGVQPGERVGLWMGQSLELALAHLAVYKLGAIALPLSVLFGEDALLYRLEHAGARLLIADRATLQALNPHLPAEIGVLYQDEVLDLLQAAQPQFRTHPTKADDPALLIYTSGTTGKPKGVLLPHRTLIGHLPGFRLFCNFPKDEAVYWSAADWAWIGGLLNVLLCAWAHAYTVVAYRTRRFDPEEALHLLHSQAVTHTFLFPTALKLLRQLGRVKAPPFLQSVHSGGEPLGAELLAWVQENLGLPVNEFYGQTEANLLVGNSYTTDPIRAGSMGLPYPGHQVEILDEAGQPLPPGAVGEIALRTPDPVAFLGYWNNPQATQQKFIGPYLKTGDLGHKDEAGYLWFKARADDLIKAAGYRISPFEVEEALMHHPAVAMVAVVGVPDAERGQRIVAHIKLREGQSGSAALTQALQEEVRRRVGHHAYPREVHYVDALPLTPTGKIQRFKLRG
ncbi:MAG: AMP-binding protein [Meiothermus sp.]|uniref:AMP-binding protein n=1 Tax=Meiothermus sp. TaxID=1955249 RepID=UPI0025E9C094|nr:AMP-binding protein [Meiothermus sp.]MCS7069034.1 AMP-binding protein [Meiothermus sp.]MDW8425017.1 AMP-binding protein [Meiothermus sp.]